MERLKFYFLVLISCACMNNAFFFAANAGNPSYKGDFSGSIGFF